MKRPQAHITDSLGEAQMRAIFEPLGWAVSNIQHDYGVDFDIQIFAGKEATGEWFKVQLKSSSATRYSSDGGFVQQPLETSHAIHYAQDMKDPILIVHADTEKGNTFWHAPQLDDNLASLIREEGTQRTVTVRIPTRNALPETLKEMMEALRKVQIVLGARKLSGTPIGDFVDTIRRHGDPEAVSQDFRNRLDAMKLQKVHDLFREGQYMEAGKEVKTILENDEASIEMKFSAILEEGDIKWVEWEKQRRPQSELAKLRLETAKKLQMLVKKGPTALKFHALITRKAAELEVLTFRDFGLYMNWKSQTQRGDPMIALAVYIELVHSARLVARKFNQCVRLAQYAAESPHAWAVPTALLKIVQGAVSFTIRAEEDQQETHVTAYSSSALGICRLAASIAATTGDDDSLGRVVGTSMLLYLRLPRESLEFARETITKIRDAEVRTSAEEVLDRDLRRARGQVFEGDRKATAEQIYENMAAGLGINMGDPTNPLTRIVRRGIRDLNPGRALQMCDESFVSRSGRMMTIVERSIASQLNLPTIGPKIIHCVLHGYAVEHRTLDEAHSLFKSRYCDTCPDRSPRASDWEWTDDWQEEENERRREFMESFWRRRGKRS